jgi:hypothetical protein
MIHRAALIACCAAALAAAAGCAKPVDLKQNVEVADLVAGWFDAGIVNGQNKIVPSVTFRLKRKPEVEIKPLALNVVFKNADGSDSSFEDIYIARVAFEGNQTQPITARSKNGYTADPPQTRADMLKNSQFRDVAVQIFAKQSSAQWVELQRVVLQRQILTN